MTGRLRSAAVIAAVTAGALLGSGCGVPDQAAPVDISGVNLPAPPSTVAGSSPQPGKRVRVYFVANSDTLIPVVRSDPAGDLAAAIRDLLAGPSRHEVAAGITSAVPSGTRLRNAQLADGTATLDFTEPLTSLTGHEEMLAFAEIVSTAGAAPGVDRVVIDVAGQPVNAPEPNGTLAQGPVTAADYASLISGG